MRVSPGSGKGMPTFVNERISATPTVIMLCAEPWNPTSKLRHSGPPETTMLSCVGTPVRACSCRIRRFAPCRIRSFNQSLASSGERFAEICSHLIDEAMDRRLCDAMPSNRIDGPPQGTKGWFVKSTKIQLGFGAGQRIDRKLSLHEWEQGGSRHRFPFEQQPGGRARREISNFFFDAFNRNLDICLDADTAQVHVQLGGDRLSSRSGRFRRCPEDIECVSR